MQESDAKAMDLALSTTDASTYGRSRDIAGEVGEAHYSNVTLISFCAGKLAHPEQVYGSAPLCKDSISNTPLPVWCGDYSAVMVIEARLRQLKCLPACGGVRTADFISTWRASINQMEAAGFLPGLRQLLSMFADGLPNNTVAFINLYDSIMLCLNDSDDNALPNIHLGISRGIAAGLAGFLMSSM